MFTLRTLGSIALTASDGSEVDAVLRQPKAVALLAYLAMPRPGTWHRRDALLATFWPELDPNRARSSLRSALHALRRSLSSDAIVTRGDDDVSLDPAVIATDAGALQDDIEAGRLANALARYGGDFLPALYVTGASGFDEWLDKERRRLRVHAMTAATKLSTACETAGELAGAVHAAQRAVEVDPDDEPASRRLMRLLDRAGDRAQAMAVFERLRRRLAAEFEAEPSAETIALAQTLKQSVAVRAEADFAERAPHSRSAETDVPPPAPGALPRKPRRVRMALFAALLVGAAALLILRIPPGAATPGVAPRLLILPMRNETGDPQLAYIAAGLGEGIARRLSGIGRLSVRTGARLVVPDSSRRGVDSLANLVGAKTILMSRLTRVGDSLEVQGTIIEFNGGERPLAARRFPLDKLRDAESGFTASIVAALFRSSVSAVPRITEKRVDPESYRLTLEGWHQFLTLRNPERARTLFLDATTRDPENARAWSGLSSVWASQAAQTRIPFDEGYERAVFAAERALALDSLQGSALVNLAFLRAMKARRLSVGLALLERAKAAEPSNSEVFLVAAALFRHAWQWDRALDDVRIARELDLLSPFYLEREATLYLCAGRPEQALRLIQEELRLTPNDAGARFGLARVLAWLGRFDEAIDAWRATAAAAGDTATLTLLRSARGASGYWAARHSQGRAVMAAVERDRAQNAWVSSQRYLAAAFASGDTVRGFPALEAAVASKEYLIYRLPCMPEFDEFRSTQHFRDILRRVGGLPPD